MQQLIETLTERNADRNTEAADEFDKLAASIAEGDEPEVEYAESILRAADRSPGELSAEVDRLKGRQHLRAQFAGGAQAEADQREAVAAIERAEQVLAAAREEFRRTVAPLDADLEDARRRVRDADQARRSLIETAPEKLRDELASVRADIAQTQSAVGRLSHRQQEAERDVQQHTARASSIRRHDMLRDPNNREAHEADSARERCDRIVAECVAQIADANGQIKTLSERQTALIEKATTQ